MKRTLCAVGLGALSLAWVAPGHAQVPDHLKCYKVKDPQAKKTYTADLGGLVAEPGCTIKVPAAMACVPATKTNVTPTPPGGGGTGTPNSFFCYKVKCPKATLPTLDGTDQFGSRTVTPSAAKFVCAPLAAPPGPRFVDNGDGTVTDHETGLIWEQKVFGFNCLHCVDDGYTWSASGSAPDGTAFTSFLNTLNGGATGVGDCVTADGSTITGGFTNHCDWRLPTVVELKTIVDPLRPGCGSEGGPSCIDPIFGSTVQSVYWSSTTDAVDPLSAWVVGFNTSNGPSNALSKPHQVAVRAVRGGS